MKLLLTCYDYRPRLGGIATLGFELARALAKRSDVELLLAAPDQPGAAEFDRHGLFETRRLALAGDTATDIPRMTASLGKLLEGEKPDALMNLLWLPSGVASYLLSWVPGRSRCPYFLYAHGVELLESSSNFRKKLRRQLAPVKKRVFRSARAVFANSANTARLVEESCGASPGRIVVASPGTDPEIFRPAAQARDLARQYGLEGKKVFLTISRLEDYKGVDRAIASFARVARDRQDVAYLVCGKGPDEKRLASLARLHRVEKQVIFAGNIPAERLVDHYNLADCFVLLSREELEAPNVEGFGIVFLEAAACGKPSIGGASGGIPEAVVDGETGWIVDPRDDEAIARAMREALEKPELAEARGRAGRARVEAKLTWDSMARTIVEGIRTHVRD